MRRYLFADESGDFGFSNKPNVSRYYTICTVTCNTCEIGTKLLELRRELAWEKAPLGEYFHASEDKQEIRNRVFDLLRSADFQIDATIMEKRKAQPQVRGTNSVFYRYGWFYHFRNIARRIFDAPTTELLITAASVGTRKQQATFTSVVNNVVQQIAPGNLWSTYFCPAASDPCLQVADYCAWAIHKKWERKDTRSYDLIHAKIRREYDLWSHGTKTYY
jgi:hypothetical protein